MWDLQSDSKNDHNAEDVIPYSNVDWERNGQKLKSFLKKQVSMLNKKLMKICWSVKGKIELGHRLGAYK
jgi:hypothetical protein